MPIGFTARRDTAIGNSSLTRFGAPFGAPPSSGADFGAWYLVCQKQVKAIRAAAGAWQPVRWRDKSPDEIRTANSIVQEMVLTISFVLLRLTWIESDSYFKINHNTCLYLPKLVDTYPANTTPRSDYQQIAILRVRQGR
jgi:hypothetical protein